MNILLPGIKLIMKNCEDHKSCVCRQIVRMRASHMTECLLFGYGWIHFAVKWLLFFPPSCYLSPAHKSDGVNLKGFYVWKLQDRHVPQFGLFTSTQHQSKAKASVAVYREIIAHNGFADDGGTPTCRLRGPRESCSVCEWMFKNKALLVFGGCLLTTAVMLVALIAFVTVTKRHKTRGRERRRGRRRRAPVCFALVKW